MKCSELPESLMAGYHTGDQGPASGFGVVQRFARLRSAIREKISFPTAANSERSRLRKPRRALGIVHTNFVRAELSMRQSEEEVICQVFPKEEGPLLPAGGAEEEGLAREGPEVVIAAVWAADTGDSVLPVAYWRHAAGIEGLRRS